MNNWAPFFSGYKKHEQLSDTDSIWWLTGDIGVLSRIVKFQVHITEWSDYKKIAFTLKGLNENVEGEGTFLLAPYTPETRVQRSDIVAVLPLMQDSDTSASELTFKLKMSAGGIIGPAINAMLKPVLRPMAEDFAKKIATWLEKG